MPSASTAAQRTMANMSRSAGAARADTAAREVDFEGFGSWIEWTKTGEVVVLATTSRWLLRMSRMGMTSKIRGKRLVETRFVASRKGLEENVRRRREGGREGGRDITH